MEPPNAQDSEIDVQELLDKYSWTMRPCFLYDEEYSDCTRIMTRFHQKFVFGELQDCSQWKHDYENCKKWEKEQNPQALKDLIDSELKKREVRLKAHYANTVWEKRTEPPSDWNAPLPPWIEERVKTSYLNTKAEFQKGTTSFCSIM